MNDTGFNSADWSHWLLIVCFVAVAAVGLWLSWQWRLAHREKRRRSRLSRRLALELHQSTERSQQVITGLSAGETRGK
jgi:hypothetical protein